jgi:hypothetical protein
MAFMIAVPCAWRVDRHFETSLPVLNAPELASGTIFLGRAFLRGLALLRPEDGLIGSVYAKR